MLEILTDIISAMFYTLLVSTAVIEPVPFSFSFFCSDHGEVFFRATTVSIVHLLEATLLNSQSQISVLEWRTQKKITYQNAQI